MPEGLAKKGPTKTKACMGKRGFLDSLNKHTMSELRKTAGNSVQTPKMLSKPFPQPPG